MKANMAGKSFSTLRRGCKAQTRRLAAVASALALTGLLLVASPVPASYATPETGPAASPCYRQLREDLGTVLPGSTAFQEATCAAAPVPVLSLASVSCYRQLRSDLGTVLPARLAFQSAACAPAASTMAPATLPATGSGRVLPDTAAASRPVTGQ